MKNSNNNTDGTTDGLMIGKDLTRNAGAIIISILQINNVINALLT